MIIDHVGFGVSDYERAKAFYARGAGAARDRARDGGDAGAEPGKVWACGFGKAGKPEFWIGSDGKTTPPAACRLPWPRRAPRCGPFTRRRSRAGGSDNGAPGLRPQYHPNYYGAFVLDLDGHNVEAVCHKPE